MAKKPKNTKVQIEFPSLSSNATPFNNSLSNNAVNPMFFSPTTPKDHLKELQNRLGEFIRTEEILSKRVSLYKEIIFAKIGEKEPLNKDFYDHLSTIAKNSEQIINKFEEIKKSSLSNIQDLNEKMKYSGLNQLLNAQMKEVGQILPTQLELINTLNAKNEKLELTLHQKETFMSGETTSTSQMKDETLHLFMKTAVLKYPLMIEALTKAAANKDLQESETANIDKDTYIKQNAPHLQEIFKDLINSALEINQTIPDNKPPLSSSTKNSSNQSPKKQARPTQSAASSNNTDTLFARLSSAISKFSASKSPVPPLEPIEPTAPSTTLTPVFHAKELQEDFDDNTPLVPSKQSTQDTPPPLEPLGKEMLFHVPLASSANVTMPLVIFSALPEAEQRMIQDTVTAYAKNASSNPIQILQDTMNVSEEVAIEKLKSYLSAPRRADQPEPVGLQSFINSAELKILLKDSSEDSKPHRPHMGG